MDRLALHIEYLLLRHECVVVPGLGAFMSVRHDAHDVPEKGCVAPTMREVRFNSALRHDDGLLATSFARREKVPFAEGREMVRLATRHFMDSLRADSTVSVGRLGLLEKDSDGNILFRPAFEPRLLAERLGLFDAKCTRIPATTSSPAELPTQEQSVSENNGRIFDTEHYYYLPVNKMFARIAGLFAIIAMISLSVILPFTGNLNEDQASIVPVKAITSAISDTPAPKPVETPATETVTPAAPSVPLDWHLIVATFRTRNDAEAYVANHRDCGYDLTIVPSRTLCRVSAQSASSKDALLPALNSPSFRTQFPGSWIFHP